MTRTSSICSWGRIINGGAWLKHGECRVGVLLRDLDVVEHWTRKAENGEFEWVGLVAAALD
jgi:hypothetical protein